VWHDPFTRVTLLESRSWTSVLQCVAVCCSVSRCGPVQKRDEKFPSESLVKTQSHVWHESFIKRTHMRGITRACVCYDAFMCGITNNIWYNINRIWLYMIK